MVTRLRQSILSSSIAGLSEVVSASLRFDLS